MTIKAFIFDCGGVLLRDADLTPYSVWESRLGLQPGALAACLWRGEIWSLAEVGAITDDEYWRRICAHLGVTDPEQSAALHDEIWQTWQVDEQVLALIDRLRERYRVAMLSNATDALDALLAERYAVADRFEVLGNSARLHVAKPDPAAYQAVLGRLGLKPEEVVFVDDRAENISAAAALGMHVIWFVNARELERQLAVYLRTPTACVARPAPENSAQGEAEQ